MKHIKKAIPIIIILILLLFIKSKVSEIERLKKTSTSIENVQKELQEKKEEKALLTEQLKYFQSNEYVEIKAREKLNLTKKGEALVITSSNNTQDERKNQPIDKEVWQKWHEKLF